MYIDKLKCNKEGGVAMRSHDILSKSRLSIYLRLLQKSQVNGFQTYLLINAL